MEQTEAAMVNKVLRLIGFIAAISSAFVGQAELIGEPWHHYMSIAGIICAVTLAYFQQPPRSDDSRDRVSDSTLKEINHVDKRYNSIT